MSEYFTKSNVKVLGMGIARVTSLPVSGDFSEFLRKGTSQVKQATNYLEEARKRKKELKKEEKQLKIIKKKNYAGWLKTADAEIQVESKNQSEIIKNDINNRLSELAELMRKAQEGQDDGFCLFSYRPNTVERTAIQEFIRNSPVASEKREDELSTKLLLNLVFNCGISNQKGFILPAVFQGAASYQMSTSIANNIYLDDIRFYRNGADARFFDETFAYNRRVMQSILSVPDLENRMSGLYQQLFKKLNGISRRKVPYLNLDIRLVADTYKEIKANNYKIIVTDINLDFQDFLADMSSFEESGLIKKEALFAPLVTALTKDIKGGSANVAIVAPDKWYFRGFYRKEINLLSAFFAVEGFTVDIVESSQYYLRIRDKKYSKVINYAADYGIDGSNVVPSPSAISSINDRIFTQSLLKEAGVPTPEALLVKDFRYNGAQSFEVSYDRLLKFFERGNVDVEKFYPLCVLKSKRQKQQPVQFISLSDKCSYSKISNYSYRGGAIIEELITSPWLRELMKADSCEIKTLGVQP